MEQKERSNPAIRVATNRRLLTRRNALVAAGIAVAGAVLALFRLRQQGTLARQTLMEALRKGQQLNRERRYSEAVKEFTRINEAQNDFTEAYVFRGIALFNSEQFAEAAVDFSKVLEMDPHNMSVRLYRGESYLAMDREDEAAEDFLSVQANSPDQRLIAAANAKLQAIGPMRCGIGHCKYRL